jgi:Na+/alanine symporter
MSEYFNINLQYLKLFCQQMHYLLKHKMLLFVFKYLYMAPTRFGPSGPLSGSMYWNFTKVTVPLKHQLNHVVKIIVVQWQ